MHQKTITSNFYSARRHHNIKLNAIVLRMRFRGPNLTYFFNVSLTVHLSTTLVNDQLDAQFLFIIRLLQSSTCFELRCAHHQEVNCINTASGIVSLCKWPSGAPDAVLIKFDLLMMSKTFARNM